MRVGFSASSAEVEPRSARLSASNSAFNEFSRTTVRHTGSGGFSAQLDATMQAAMLRWRS